MRETNVEKFEKQLCERMTLIGPPPQKNNLGVKKHFPVQVTTASILKVRCDTSRWPVMQRSHSSPAETKDTVATQIALITFTRS